MGVGNDHAGDGFFGLLVGGWGGERPAAGSRRRLGRIWMGDNGLSEVSIGSFCASRYLGDVCYGRVRLARRAIPGGFRECAGGRTVGYRLSLTSI